MRKCIRGMEGTKGGILQSVPSAPKQHNGKSNNTAQQCQQSVRGCQYCPNAAAAYVSMTTCLPVSQTCPLWEQHRCASGKSGSGLPVRLLRSMLTSRACSCVHTAVLGEPMLKIGDAYEQQRVLALGLQSYFLNRIDGASGLDLQKI